MLDAVTSKQQRQKIIILSKLWTVECLSSRPRKPTPSRPLLRLFTRLTARCGKCKVQGKQPNFYDRFQRTIYCLEPRSGWGRSERDVQRCIGTSIIEQRVVDTVPTWKYLFAAESTMCSWLSVQHRNRHRLHKDYSYEACTAGSHMHLSLPIATVHCDYRVVRQLCRRSLRTRVLSSSSFSIMSNSRGVEG
jgi:hypothetical protein